MKYILAGSLVALTMATAIVPAEAVVVRVGPGGVGVRARPLVRVRPRVLVAPRVVRPRVRRAPVIIVR